LNRIAVEASKQCGRTKPTHIENTLNFGEAIKRYASRKLAITLRVYYEVTEQIILRTLYKHLKI